MKNVARYYKWSRSRAVLLPATTTRIPASPLHLLSIHLTLIRCPGLQRQRHGFTECLPSGSGKTTLLRMVNRLEEPTRGSVLLAGKDVAEADVIALRRRIGYVIQTGGLFPHMTVAANVGVMCRLEGWPAKKIDDRVCELLELVNLPHADYSLRYPSELSGGERQRVGVARALALDPEYLLMDEPFGALDPITRLQLHREFEQLQERLQKTVLLVTHDLAEAFALADRVSLLHEGVLVQTGSEADLVDSPATPFVSEFLLARGLGRLPSGDPHSVSLDSGGGDPDGQVIDAEGSSDDA